MPTTVADVMSTPALTLAAETPVDEAAGAMLEAGIKSLVVIDDDCRPLGIVTSTDVVRLAAEDGRASAATVGDYMSTDVVTTTPGARLPAVAERMLGADITHLPVTRDGEVVGIVTTTDLAEHLAGRVADGEAAD
jgi:signal-transduction protein with cAMP-binding, CBS, and nucleotidyltransferase domain